ncbi:MAG: histidinol dehydrogenase, partial [Rhabdochlamydiaceae bacterium]
MSQMKTFFVEGEADLEVARLFENTQRDTFSSLVGEEVQAILADLANDSGEADVNALVKLANKFDSLRISESNLVAVPSKCPLEQETSELILAAIDRVRTFHQAQKDSFLGQMSQKGSQFRWSIPLVEGTNGIDGQIIRPLRRVGIYIPGGKGNYPSSVIMNV